MKITEDAYGQQLLTQYNSQIATAEFIERDDNYIDIGSEAGQYFSEYDQWPPLERLAIERAKGRVLDIGCGAGRHSLYLQQKGFDVTAIDNSPGAIEVCTLRGLKNAIVKAIADVDEFEPKSFDTILMFGNNFGLFGDTEPIAEDVADFILNLVNATPETTFLEPGVGTGLNVLPLVRRGYSVTGIDVSQEMLNQFRQKLPKIPPNLNLIHGDASQLPFADSSFDIVLTVHMLHTVTSVKTFLDEIDRVLKPNGFYLNAQWITPPARREFEQYFRTILSQYEEPKPPQQTPRTIDEINVEDYLRNKGYQCSYFVAKEWTVSNTVQELLNFYRSRAYGLCWLVADEAFHLAMEEFEGLCQNHYRSLEAKVSSPAKFEIWAYSVSQSDPESGEG